MISWPAQPNDLVEAIAWIRSNIGSRGGDPDKIVLVGHSSGATLVALVASDQRYLSGRGLRPGDLRGVVSIGSIMWDDELQSAMQKYDRPRIEAAFRRDPSNAMYRDLDEYLDRWPMHHVHRGMPPFLFLIAEEEIEKPPVLRTNKAFVDSAVALGNAASYQILRGRSHYTAISSLHQPGDVAFDTIVTFVRRVASTEPPSS